MFSDWVGCAVGPLSVDFLGRGTSGRVSGVVHGAIVPGERRLSQFLPKGKGLSGMYPARAEHDRPSSQYHPTENMLQLGRAIWRSSTTASRAPSFTQCFRTRNYPLIHPTMPFLALRLSTHQEEEPLSSRPLVSGISIQVHVLLSLRRNLSLGPGVSKTHPRSRVYCGSACPCILDCLSWLVSVGRHPLRL